MKLLNQTEIPLSCIALYLSWERQVWL